MTLVCSGKFFNGVSEKKICILFNVFMKCDPEGRLTSAAEHHLRGSKGHGARCAFSPHRRAASLSFNNASKSADPFLVLADGATEKHSQCVAAETLTPLSSLSVKQSGRGGKTHTLV